MSWLEWILRRGCEGGAYRDGNFSTGGAFGRCVLAAVGSDVEFLRQCQAVGAVRDFEPEDGDLLFGDDVEEGLVA